MLRRTTRNKIPLFLKFIYEINPKSHSRPEKDRILRVPDSALRNLPK